MFIETATGVFREPASGYIFETLSIKINFNNIFLSSTVLPDKYQDDAKSYFDLTQCLIELPQRR